MRTTVQDLTLGTSGWSVFAGGTVGLTKGQTIRLSIVNLSPTEATVLCGLWSNPDPVSLVQDSPTLGPGEGQHCDMKASDLSGEKFDKEGRVQIRALVRSSSHMIGSNLEVFESKTGRTSVVLSLQRLARHE